MIPGREGGKPMGEPAKDKERQRIPVTLSVDADRAESPGGHKDETRLFVGLKWPWGTLRPWLRRWWKRKP